MTDAEYERVKAHVGALFEKWAWLVHEFGWRLDLTWDRESYRPPEGDKPDVLVQFTAHATWRYLRANIEIFTPSIDLDDPRCVENLETCVIHELMHVLVSEMREDEAGRFDHEERVCEMLARLFMRASERKVEAGTD